ncbi:MAG TPA: extracellular solute-binding protein [Thermodesulfobacteriota bacterium]|nr:extracellular solute-binding protein [Thermodesulfobacteriota bacterium]
MMKEPGFLTFFCILFLAFPIPVSSQVVLRMIGPEDLGGAWTEIVERFHERNPGIRIRYIPGPWSTDQRQDMYIRSFISGDPYELVYMDVIWTAKFAEKGWLLPLEEWFPPEKQEAFLPGDIEAGHYKGRFYRVPVRSDAGVLYYRKDLVPGPPATWLEFEGICRKYSHPPERYGIVFQGMQYEGLVCNYLEYLWGAGGSVLDEEGKVHLETQENILALEFMRRIIDEGWAPKSVITFQEQHSLEFFEQGKALMMRNWPYAWKILNDSPLRGKIGIAPFIHRPGRESATTLGGWGLGIARVNRHPREAGRFIEFVTSPEAQKIMHFKRGAVPSRKSLFKDEDILKESPHYRDLYEVLSRARPRPVHPDYPRISSILQKHVSGILVGIESPAEAANHMDRSLEGLLKGKERGWLKRLALDYDLHRTLKNTALFTGISVPLEFLLGLLAALLLNLPFKGRSLGRLAVLIPWALPTAVMAMTWQWMFNNPFGVINDVLMRAGFLRVPFEWLSTPEGAMFAALFADIWKTTPFVTIILLGGLQSIPKDLEESLSLDGAGPVKNFFHLALPMLIPFIRVALIFRMIHAAGIFDLIWVLTKGGPADSTRTLSLYLYDLAFRYDEIGYSLFLTFLFLVTLILISFAITRALTLRYERIGR